MFSVDGVFQELQAEQNEIQLMSENETIIIDAEQRTIVIPESVSLFGVKFDKDVERKYFQCPKIVGDNIDLSQCQIYIAYVTMATKNQQYPETGVGLYNCDDVEINGDNITFSWKLSGNVFTQEGYIAFKVVAKQSIGGELSTRWNTVPAFGTILNTISDGEDIVEQYPDIINQILDRLDELEQGGGTGGISDYNNLSNKPQLNGVDLIGNKTLDDVGAVAKNQGTGNAGKVLGIGENGIVIPMESGGGIPGQDGEDGGYYTPTVTQPTDETMQMSFAASKPSMPPVQPVTINLPSGGDALNGLPSGGTTGQVLSKKTNTDYDVEWTDAPVGGDTPRQQMQNTDTTVTLEPNILYVFPEMESLTVTLGTPSDTNVANEYHFFFTSGQIATTLTLNDALSDAYSIDANMKYEVSILENVAYIKGVSTSAET